MNIKQVRPISGDLSLFAEHRLRMHTNVDFSTKALIERHNLPHEFHDMAKEQAKEIRSCLLQAGEYLLAAKSVSLSTKPLLLYYGLMSLALASTLAKGDRAVRLKRLRDSHSAHGLTLSVRGSLARGEPFEAITGRLWAVPQERSKNVRYGTFEIWRQHMRELPVPSMQTMRNASGSLSSGMMLGLLGSDEMPPPTPEGGLSLLQALKSIPSIATDLAHINVIPDVIKLRPTTDLDWNNNGDLTFVIQPAPPQALEEFSHRIKFNIALAQSARVNDDYRSGYSIHIPIEEGRVQGNLQMNGVLLSEGAFSHMAAADWGLGEFGAFYVALHITGNLARYHPDEWVPHVERSTPMAEIVLSMCEAAQKRLVINTASELDAVHYFQAP